MIARIRKAAMFKKIIDEIQTLKDFSEDVEMKQNEKELEAIKLKREFIKGKITACNEILDAIQKIIPKEEK